MIHMQNYFWFIISLGHIFGNLISNDHESIQR